ncbi:MAG: hypothetical protein NC548_36025 [Lachnospiraceae bacterium]|nr:hypothetical protein [Lachnospiraceae bacterium]
MKSISIKKILTGILLALPIALSAIGFAFFGMEREAAQTAQAASSPTIVISSDPLYKSDPYKEFTVTVRMEGISSSLPGGGLFGAEVKLTPQEAELLDFVEFVPNSNLVTHILSTESRHEQGEYIVFASNNMGQAMTSDFDVGGYTFKLKQGVSVPNSLTFKCVDVASADMSGSGEPMNLAEASYTLTLGEKEIIGVTKPAAISSAEKGYSGEAVDFTPSGLADLVSAGRVKLYSVSGSTETEVGIDAFKPTNAGTYKVVARLNGDYCWGANNGDDTADITYDFTVKKAVLTATAAGTGKLPTFTSDSYKGSMDGLVEYKYYSDAACTQEVALADLAPGTTYYTKAALKAGAEANFEFDSGAVTQGYVGSSFEYEVADPSGSNNGGGDDEKKEDEGGGIPLKTWIIIGAAVVGLLLLLLIIILIVKHNKKKQEEAKKQTEEEKRRDEERKEASVAAAVAAATAPAAQLVQPAAPAAPAQPVVVPVPTPAAPAPAAEATPVAQTEKLEERLHEAERELQEREITRYKEEADRAREEAERARKEAEAKSAPVVAPVAASVQPTTAGSDVERVKELEARLLEAERELREREITRYKEEAERARKEAEQKSTVPAAPAPTDSATLEIVKKLEMQLETMRQESREKEMAALKEELERTRREMEEAKRAQQQPAQPVVQPTQPIVPQVAMPQQSMSSVQPLADTAAQERIKELETRVWEMEQGTRDRELAKYKEDLERAYRTIEQRNVQAMQPALPPQTYYTASAEAAKIRELEERWSLMERANREDAERQKRAEEEFARRRREQEDELRHLWELQERSKRVQEPVYREDPQVAMREKTKIAELEEQLSKQNEELKELLSGLLKHMTGNK